MVSVVIIRKATSKLPADGAGFVVDVPLLDARQAVRVRAGQDHVRLPLQADTALLQRGAFEQSR